MAGRLLLVCCFASMVLSPAAASAREDAATAQARARWYEGVRAFEAGEFESARVAFAQVYALKPTPPVLRNLGEAEIASGHYVSGANHLTRFLGETDELEPEEREKVKRSIAKAEAHVGRLELITDAEGAQVFVEGELVGVTPLEHAVYLEPGWREVRLSKEGREVQRIVEAEAGHLVSLELRFEEKQDLEVASVSASAPRLMVEEGKPGWKTPVVIGGAALAVTGLGVGGYFYARVHSLAEQAHTLRTQVGPSRSACTGSSDLRCIALRDTVDEGLRAERFARVGFVAGGVLALGTALAWWLWPSPSSSSADLPVTALWAAPYADPSGSGLWGVACSGAF